MAEYTAKIIWQDNTETQVSNITAGANWLSGATRDVLDITFLEGATLEQAQNIGKNAEKVGSFTVVAYQENASSVNVPATVTELRTAYSDYSIYAGVYDDEAGSVHLKLGCELVQREKELMQKVDTLTAQNSELQGALDSLILETLNGGKTA